MRLIRHGDVEMSNIILRLDRQENADIVIAAGHREQMFPVLREAIERLKAEVPIWKKEHTLEGEWWVHDTSVGK